MAGAVSPTAMAAATATDLPRQVAHGHLPTDLLSEARASAAGPYLDAVQIRTRLKTGPAGALTRLPPLPRGNSRRRSPYCRRPRLRRIIVDLYNLINNTATRCCLKYTLSLLLSMLLSTNFWVDAANNPLSPGLNRRPPHFAMADRGRPVDSQDQ